MNITCPHCGISGQAADSLAECEVSCPECGGKFIAGDAADSSGQFGQREEKEQKQEGAIPPWLQGQRSRNENILRPAPEITAWGIVRESWQLSRNLRFAVICRVGAVLLFMVMVPISLLLDGDSGVVISMFTQAGLPSVVLGALGLLLTLVSMGISGNVEAGLPYLGIRHGMGKRVGLATCFRGFSKPHFKNLFVAGIIKTGVTMMGFMLLIVPGIYLSVAYWLAMPLIIDRELAPWQALELSRKAITKVWFQVFGAYLIMTVLPFIVPVMVAVNTLSRGFVQQVEQSGNLGELFNIYSMFPGDVSIIAGCLVVIIALVIYLLPCVFASYGVLYNKLFTVK